MSIPADPLEVCEGCGKEKSHMTAKREGWEPQFTGEEGEYVLYCPECQDPDPKDYRTLDEFGVAANTTESDGDGR